MTIKQALSRAREILAINSIEDPPLESELLLRHTLQISRVQLHLRFEQELSSIEEKTFWQLIERRITHEPAAYITGHREFYGLDFYIEPGVLIPRPESELLVEKAIELAKTHSVTTIAEVGTGSGAIAISLALNLPQTKIYATDISAHALQVASLNCQRHQVTERVHLLEGDMLDPLPEPVDIIVANLPYVRASELRRVNTFGFEPLLALDGGTDGLEKIRRLCTQASNYLRPEGHLLLEIGKGQKRALTTFLHRLFPTAEIEVTPDLNGVARVLSLSLQTADLRKVPVTQSYFRKSGTPYNR